MHALARTAHLFGIVMLGTVASPAVVLAADLAADYPTIEAPEPMAIPASGGWYLRGDIGYKFYADPNAKLSNSLYGGGTQYLPPHNSLTNEKLGGAADIGVGVGYKFNDYLRTDLTIDYETPAKFKGSLWCDSVISSSCSSSNYHDTERAKITAWSGLLNGYVDLGTYAGLTPYVGAGAGVSYLQTSNIRSSSKNAFAPYNYPDGDDKWNFAWALMAGVSYAINQNLSLDLGYRYLNLGDAKTGYIVDSSGVSTRFDYKDIQAHEVRVGLRYMLN